MSQEHPDLEQYRNAAADAVRAAFEAGILVGIARGSEHERNRLHNLILAETKAPIARPVVSLSHAEKVRKAPSAPTYGAISAPVRSALEHLGPSYLLGVGPKEIAEYCNHNLGTKIDARQAMTALKQMANRKEAVRVTRGRYLPAPKEGQEKPGVTAPGPSTDLLEEKEVGRVANG